MERSIDTFSSAIRENKRYLWENKYDMDGAEKASIRQSLEVSMFSTGTIVDKRHRLLKLLDAPYFGRLDFIENGALSTAFLPTISPTSCPSLARSVSWR